MRTIYLILGVIGIIGGILKIAIARHVAYVIEGVFTIAFGTVIYSLVGIVDRITPTPKTKAARQLHAVA